MRSAAFRKRTTAWIAALAILLAALAPAVSQAAYHLSGDELWLEICTAYGIERVAVDADGQSPDDTLAFMGEGCSYCSFSAGCALVPSVCNFPLPACSGDAVVAGASQHFPRSPLALTASRPRAPPPPQA